MSEPETCIRQTSSGQLGFALTIDVVIENHECNRHIVTHLVCYDDSGERGSTLDAPCEII